MKKFFILVLTILTILSFCLCGCNDTSRENTSVNTNQQTNENSSSSQSVSVTGISLNLTSITITVGSDITLRPTIYPTNATNKNVIFSSANNSIASVNADGKICALGVGNTIITVTTVDRELVATCSVKVNPVSSNELPNVNK